MPAPLVPSLSPMSPRRPRVAALRPVTPVAVPRRKDQALSHATRWRTPVVGLTQGARPQGKVERRKPTPGARRTAPRAGQRNGKSRVGVGARRSSPRVSFRGRRCVRGMGSNESNAVQPLAGFSATGPMATAFQRHASGLPPLPTDRVEITAPLPLPGSLAAAVGGQPEPCCSLQPQCRGTRSGFQPLR